MRAKDCHVLHTFQPSSNQQNSLHCSHVLRTAVHQFSQRFQSRVAQFASLVHERLEPLGVLRSESHVKGKGDLVHSGSEQTEALFHEGDGIDYVGFLSFVIGCIDRIGSDKNRPLSSWSCALVAASASSFHRRSRGAPVGSVRRDVCRCRTLSPRARPC